MDIYGCLKRDIGGFCLKKSEKVEVIPNATEEMMR